MHFTASPTAETLWQWWAEYRVLNGRQNALVTQDDYSDKNPRYYQMSAINKTIESIARGQDRILLVMATGTGKTFTAFQIIWRLWKSKTKRRILFLADRNILVDQTMTNDFKPFGPAMTKIQKHQVDKSYEIYLSLYQAVSGKDNGVFHFAKVICNNCKPSRLCIAHLSNALPVDQPANGARCAPLQD